MKTVLYTLSSFLILIGFVGCGGNSNPAPITGQPSLPTGTIEIRQVLLRDVPAEITQQRFTGFDSEGRARFGPELRQKADTIELTGVSTVVTRLQIEYLRGDTVVGLGSVNLTVIAGETVVITNPPFNDVMAALESIEVTPAQATIASGFQQQFVAVGTFADGVQMNVTNSATWTSSSPSSTISSAGLATGVTAGQSVITASLGSVSGSASLSVSQATLTSIAVTPSTPAIADGTTQAFTAIATFTDGTTQDVTDTATWTSGNLATATIDATGLASAVGPGQTVITAAVGSVSGTATLTVSQATIVSIAVTPNTPAIADGTSQAFTAIATFTDGTTQDVTDTATWTSGNLATATIDATGLASAVSPGQTVITAAVGSVPGTATLTVTDAL